MSALIPLETTKSMNESDRHMLCLYWCIRKDARERTKQSWTLSLTPYFLSFSLKLNFFLLNIFALLFQSLFFSLFLTYRNHFTFTELTKYAPKKKKKKKSSINLSWGIKLVMTIRVKTGALSYNQIKKKKIQPSTEKKPTTVHLELIRKKWKQNRKTKTRKPLNIGLQLLQKLLFPCNPPLLYMLLCQITIKDSENNFVIGLQNHLTIIKSANNFLYIECQMSNLTKYMPKITPNIL